MMLKREIRKAVLRLQVYTVYVKEMVESIEETPFHISLAFSEMVTILPLILLILFLKYSFESHVHLLGALSFFRSLIKTRIMLATEILALRQRLAILQRTMRRPQLRR